MKYPKELRYTRTHEWARREGNRVSVGITDYAQSEISDVVFIETPKLGQSVQQGKPVAVVESVKAAFDIYAPISGKVTKVNSELESDPSRINRDCYGEGWFFELEMIAETEWQSLMTAEEYEENLKQEAK